MEIAVIQEIIAAIKAGKGKQVKDLIEQALEDGITSEQIVNQGLLPAMEQVSSKYQCEEFYVPEVILASHAMTVGTTMLETYGFELMPEPIGRAVIGTVKGDLHNIGKNLVAMMLRGAGIQVFDLGYDVEVDDFIDSALEYQADIICMSAMLTTTMPEMRKVVGKLVNKKLRERFIVMVGGAPVTEAFARSIGADIYTGDAGTAARTARAVLLSRKTQRVESQGGQEK